MTDISDATYRGIPIGWLQVMYSYLREHGVYDREDGLCYRDPEHCGCYRPACDDGFCAWGETEEDYSDGTD